MSTESHKTIRVYKWLWTEVTELSFQSCFMQQDLNQVLFKKKYNLKSANWCVGIPIESTGQYEISEICFSL